MSRNFPTHEPPKTPTHNLTFAQNTSRTDGQQMRRPKHKRTSALFGSSPPRIGERKITSLGWKCGRQIERARHVTDEGIAGLSRVLHAFAANAGDRLQIHTNAQHRAPNQLCANLPFWVRTGAPDVRCPATERALAKVDIVWDWIGGVYVSIGSRKAS